MKEEESQAVSRTRDTQDAMACHETLCVLRRTSAEGEVAFVRRYAVLICVGLSGGGRT